MDDDELAGRQLASQRAAIAAMAAGSPGGFVLDMAGGVVGCVTPVRPEHSIVNGVVYDDPDALLAALPALRVAYDDAGIIAWTVWVRPGHDEVAAALAQRGHVLDGTPRLMAAVLSDLDLEERVTLDLDPEPSITDVAHINDAAYGIPESQSFDTVFREPFNPRWSLSVARVDGEPASCLATGIHDTDCWIGLVATLPAARGRGLAGELLRGALRRARDAGATTTSLEATKLGRGVYAGLGYRDLAELQMWERRSAQ